MAKIKTLSFEEACKMTGCDPVKVLPYQAPSNKDEEAYNALKQLEILIQAYNMQKGKKWIPDYSNRNQAKWRIWFFYDQSVSAFQFGDTLDGYSDADSAAGSRHACRTEEIADHVGKEHIKLWNKWLVL